MLNRKQGDIVPRWDIIIYESDKPLISIVFKGDYIQAVIKAQTLLESYQSMDDIFKVTHYRVE